MTIAEVLDTFLEGRRLKQPTIRNARRTQRWLQRATPTIVRGNGVDRGTSGNPDPYYKPSRSVSSDYNRAEFLHHDTVSHRSMGAAPDDPGERLASDSERFRDSLTSYPIGKQYHKERYVGKREYHKSAEAYNKRVKSFEKLWRKSLKSGHVTKDGAKGPFYQPGAMTYANRRVAPRRQRVDSDALNRMITPLSRRSSNMPSGGLNEPRKLIPASMNKRSRLERPV